jgi:hypothetical protein
VRRQRTMFGPQFSVPKEISTLSSPFDLAALRDLGLWHPWLCYRVTQVTGARFTSHRSASLPFEGTCEAP